MKDLYPEKRKKPLYKELAEQVSKDILDRGLGNGDFYCTMKSLCQKFHASSITVRNAVALLEQQGILLCRSAVGIYVHDVNKLKLLNSFEKIVLLLSDQPLSSMHPFYAMRLISMMCVLIREGYSPLICDTQTLNGGELEMQASFAAGIISSIRHIEMIRNAGILDRKQPKVFYSLDPEKDRDFSNDHSCFIFYDNDSQFRLCLEYIRKQSSGKIIYVHQSQSNLPEILQKTSGLTVTDFIYRTPPTVENGKKIASRLLDFPNDTFFLIDDDYFAIGIYETALAAGIDLLREKRILVTSSPVFGITEQMGFPVIGFNPKEIGAFAAETLVRMMKEQQKVSNLFIKAVGNKNVIGSI